MIFNMKTRKTLADSIKKDHGDKLSRKEELADQIIRNYEGGEDKEILSKLTVMIPEELHNKLKMTAVQKKTKIRNLIIDYIQKL